MEQRRNEGAGETGYPRENPPTSGIVRHVSHLQNSAVTRPGIDPGSRCKGFFESVELKYRISGHSFMDCDRDFGIIEKRRKVPKPMVPKELDDIVKSARVYTPFQAIPMVTDDFIDFALLASHYINTQNLGISKTSHMKVTKKRPCIVKITNTFAFEQPSWTETNVLMDGISSYSLPAVNELPHVNFTCGIGKEARKYLLAVLPYLKEEKGQFYKGLLPENQYNSIMKEHVENS
ncbi:hypothetical protein PR048_027672 [Dryococelus australis]|uniref:Uncharacterized protein n=1 Tax=Dryococelus australis TaxID=614101 RepID=A0ABQ9GH66_9NEOP|nr:hypothetical protein PR048_027672 [Dryococelus australis]